MGARAIDELRITAGDWRVGCALDRSPTIESSGDCRLCVAIMDKGDFAPRANYLALIMAGASDLLRSCLCHPADDASISDDDFRDAVADWYAGALAPAVIKATGGEPGSFNRSMRIRDVAGRHVVEDNGWRHGWADYIGRARVEMPTVECGDGTTLCFVVTGMHRSQEESFANAALLVASPDLLGASLDAPSDQDYHNAEEFRLAVREWLAKQIAPAVLKATTRPARLGFSAEQPSQVPA